MGSEPETGGEDAAESSDGLDPIELPPDTPPEKLQYGEAYAARVDNIQDYGVFVNLTPKSGSDVSGLVYRDELIPMTRVADYNPGDPMVVELVNRKSDGDLAFRALAAPELESTVDREPKGKSTGHVADLESIMDTIQQASGATLDVENIVKKAMDAPQPHAMITDPYENLIRLIVWLQQQDYAVEHNSLVTEGDTVRLELKAVRRVGAATGTPVEEEL